MSDSERDPAFDIAGQRLAMMGAAGGLGAPLARALRARGARLFLMDADADAARSLAADLGAGTGWARADIRDPASVGEAMTRGREHLGGLDGLLNAAGLLRIAPAFEHDIEEFRRSLEINLTGAFTVSRAAAELMHAGGGAIVHIASVSSAVANPEYASYASSKAGLAQLVRVLAREWAPLGIRVNALGPAMTETAMNAPYLADPDFRRKALSAIPMNRFGRPEDLVAPLVLLLAPGGGFITGQTIYVDGGRTLV